MSETIQDHPKVDRSISDLVGVFTDPIIVMPGGWGETLPGWIKAAIPIERLLENIKSLKDKEPTGTDAEAVAYLYTASLEASLDRDWTTIYLYLAGQVMGRYRKIEIPTDIRVASLNEDQQRELRRFKQWLYQTRVHTRKERHRSERREEKENIQREKAALQPKMFEF